MAQALDIPVAFFFEGLAPLAKRGLGPDDRERRQA
jgi:hypothetical protein